MPLLLGTSSRHSRDSADTSSSNDGDNRRPVGRSASGFSVLSMLSRRSGDGNNEDKVDRPKRRLPRKNSRDSVPNAMDVERVQRRAERKKLQEALKQLECETNRELSHDEVMEIMSSKFEKRTDISKTINAASEQSVQSKNPKEDGGGPRVRAVVRRKSKESLPASTDLERNQRRLERKKLQEALRQLKSERGGEDLSHDQVMEIMSLELDQRTDIPKKGNSVATSEHSGLSNDVNSLDVAPRANAMERWFSNMPTTQTRAALLDSSEVSTLGEDSALGAGDNNDEDSDDESAIQPPDFIEFVPRVTGEVVVD